jgi:hypothetical protein
MDTRAAAEAIVADLYLHHGLGGDPQFAAEAYRRRLIVNITCILDERMAWPEAAPGCAECARLRAELARTREGA